MRTTFAVAALIGLAYAQSYNNNGPKSRYNPYGQRQSPKPDTDPDNDEEAPEQCKDKIDSLEADLNTVETTCDDQSSTLAGLQAMLIAQSATVQPITEQIYANQSTIAFSQENNNRQVTLLGDDSEDTPDPLSLQGRLNALEVALTGDAMGLEDMLEMLQTTIAEYNMTLESIEAEESRLNTIMKTVDANSAKVATLSAPLMDAQIGSISLLTDDTTTAQNTYDGIIARINTEQGLIDQQVLDNNANQATIDDLTMMIQMMAADEDYYLTNAVQISFDDATAAMIDGSDFCVGLGVYYEFYANLSFQSMQNAYITNFFLAPADDPNMILAASTVPETISDPIVERDRDHSILFKGVGTGESLQVYYSSFNGSVQMAIADPMSYQWGVKTYTTDYAAANTASTC